MKAREFLVFSSCLERALEYAFMRYQKYSTFDLPEEEIVQLKNHLESAITNEVCEYFTFDEDGNKEIRD